MKEIQKGAPKVIPHMLSEIDFYEDKLIIAHIDDEAYVVLKPIAKYLGLDWRSQYKRILCDNVLSRHISSVQMPGADNKRYKTICLQLEYLAGWLFGITPNRVKPELALKLTLYREECFRTLWRTFQASLNGVNYPIHSHLGEKDDIAFHSYYLNSTPEHIAANVRAKCRRAEKAGLPATLTFDEWLLTLDHFDWKCAYCQERPALVIEHFISTSLGWGNDSWELCT